MELIKLLKNTKSSYDVFHNNGVRMGEIYTEIDGFYVYEPILKGGYLGAAILRAIADKLDEMNEPWQYQIETYFEHQEAM